MSYEVYINPQPDILSRHLRIAVVDRHANAVSFYMPDGTVFYQTEADVEPGENIWWTLPADSAHALLAALSRHLGAVEHPEQLRADYMAERARVDKMLNALIGGRDV